MIPSKLNIGDTIGVVAPSAPLINENIEEINNSKKIIEDMGFKVKFAKNLFSNTNGYSATAIEKAEDINSMFLDKSVNMIWCAKGGENSNSVFDYLDYDAIKENPKIICGYSDITSLTNVINSQTGLVTFSGTNFKTISTDETDYSLKDAINKFVYEKKDLGVPVDYKVLNPGVCEGELIGGNVSLTRGLVAGKYSISFENKILFLEELGYETGPALLSNFLYYMKQNGVFSKISGLWLGNYSHESGVEIEKIVFDVLGDEINFPIIKSNNFGHIEEKIVIPIGVKARIDTNSEECIKLLEDFVF